MRTRGSLSDRYTHPRLFVLIQYSKSANRRVRLPQNRAASLLSRPSRQGRPLWRTFQVLDPIRLPGLTPIGRERLVPMAGRGGDLGPYESNPDWFPIEGVVGVEGSDAVVEAASYGRI